MTSSRRGLLLAAAAVLAAALPVLAAADEVPVADFARHPQFRSVRISPQGDYLAATAVVDGHAVLSLIHLADMKGISVRPRNGGDVSRVSWVSPRRVLYTVSERFDVLEQPGETGEVYAVDADGKGNRLMIGGRSSLDHYSAWIARPLRVRDNKVLVSRVHWNGSADGAYPVALWMDIDTAAVEEVTTAPIRNATFIADHAGEVRFAYANGTDLKRRVYYRAKAGTDWELLFDESKGDPLVAPLDFSRDGTRVYMMCEGAHDVGGMCSWDVASRKLTTLWSSDKAALSDVVESFDRQDIVALRSEPDRPSLTLLAKDAPESRLLVDMMKQFPGEDVLITSSTADGSKVVFYVSSATDPGSYYLFDAKARKASFLLAQRPWIKPERMAAVEPVAFKARDGLALNGYLTRPVGSEPTARNLPTVVFVHGGPYGPRDSWEFDPHVQLLASRGYAVLQVNYRGSGGYGDKFMKAGYREWGGKMQDDVTDATRWAVEQGIADPKRLCIFGGSYGGYAALEGAVKEPDLYRCAIGYVGVYDLRLMYSRGDIRQSTYGDNYLKQVLGEDQADLWNRSPLAHVDRLKAKVMLIVGGQDERVPPAHGESLHAALDKAHVAHEWLYQRTEGHGFYVEKNREELFAKILAFLDASIGNGAAAK